MITRGQGNNDAGAIGFQLNETNSLRISLERLGSYQAITVSITNRPVGTYWAVEEGDPEILLSRTGFEDRPINVRRGYLMNTLPGDQEGEEKGIVFRNPQAHELNLKISRRREGE